MAKLTDQMKNLSETLRSEVLPILKRLPAYGRLAYLLVSSQHLHLKQKSTLFLAIGYQVSPIDLIPGFIPVIGQLDDLLVLLWALKHTIASLPADQADDFLQHARVTRDQLGQDTETVRTALRATLASGARLAHRGIRASLSAGVTAATYLGYLTYYTLSNRAKKKS